MTAVMLCLGVKDDEKASGILRLLEVLLSSDRNAEKKKKILQEEYGIEMTKKLDEEVSEMCNLSKGVEARGNPEGNLILYTDSYGYNELDRRAGYGCIKNSERRQNKISGKAIIISRILQR